MLLSDIFASFSLFSIMSNVFVLITVKEALVSKSSSIEFPVIVTLIKTGLDF